MIIKYDTIRKFNVIFLDNYDYNLLSFIIFVLGKGNKTQLANLSATKIIVKTL